MRPYADTSFLVRVYSPHADSPAILKWMLGAVDPLPFTPFHRHELRNGLRLRVFRKEITLEQCKAAFEEIDSDLADGILAHAPVPWTETFREVEALGAAHTTALGVRGFDLLHVGLAVALGAKEFLTSDPRQAALASAAGLKVTP